MAGWLTVGLVVVVLDFDFGIVELGFVVGVGPVIGRVIVVCHY